MRVLHHHHSATPRTPPRTRSELLAKTQWAKSPSWEDLIHLGLAIDITAQARRYQRSPAMAALAMDTDVYERIVSWNQNAMLHHAISLDENQRLEHVLINACAAMRHPTPAEFTVQAVLSDARICTPTRQSLVLQGFVGTGGMAYLIT